MPTKKTTKKTTKKKTTKRGPKARHKPEELRTFTIRIPHEDVDFLDKSAYTMNTSRQKLLATMIRGMRLADEDSEKQGTFFHMYTDHLTSLIEDAISKKHGR